MNECNFYQVTGQTCYSVYCFSLVVQVLFLYLSFFELRFYPIKMLEIIKMNEKEFKDRTKQIALRVIKVIESLPQTMTA